jgi:predicted HicB family RNase H-like nuclease
METRKVITLRISETLASKLSNEADELGISRNALIVLKLLSDAEVS